MRAGKGRKKLLYFFFQIKPHVCFNLTVQCVHHRPERTECWKCVFKCIGFLQRSLGTDFWTRSPRYTIRVLQLLCLHLISAKLACTEMSQDDLLRPLTCYNHSCKGTLPVPNISTTPFMAMGCWQCLPLSFVQLKGKHCRKPHCRNGVVGTFEH